MEKLETTNSAKRKFNEFASTGKPENKKSFIEIRDELLYELNRHPDRGGDNESAAEINVAYEKCLNGSEADCEKLMDIYKKAKTVKVREI